jgi:hypothetical protein
MAYTHKSADKTAQMTSNTAPSPNVASSSGAYNAGSEAWYAFNHDSSGFWDSSSGAFPKWLKYDFGSALYAIISYDILPYVGEAPTSWKFQGSNNDTDWTDLDTQTGISGWANDTVKSFSFSNTTAYRYYRLYVSAAQHANYCGIREVELFADDNVNIAPGRLNAQTVLSCTPQVQLAAPMLESACVLAIADIYNGYFMVVDAFAVAGGLSASLMAELLAPDLSSPAVISADLVTALFEAAVLPATGELLQSGIFSGLWLTPQPLQAIAGMDADIEVSLLPQALNAATHFLGSLSLGILVVPLQAIGEVGLGSLLVLPDVIGPVTYECVLSGAEDGETDVTLPITSFQGRFRSGDPSYLAVNVPSMEYAADITARSNGSLSVYIIKTIGDNRIRELLITVDLEDVRTDVGTDRQTITLSGHRTETPLAKTVTFDDVYYANVINGWRRFRCPPDLYLKPGDTVVIDGETMTADLITWAVSVDYCTMEIAEEGS